MFIEVTRKVDGGKRLVNVHKIEVVAPAKENGCDIYFSYTDGTKMAVTESYEQVMGAIEWVTGKAVGTVEHI